MKDRQQLLPPSEGRFRCTNDDGDETCTAVWTNLNLWFDFHSISKNQSPGGSPCLVLMSSTFFSRWRERERHGNVMRINELSTCTAAAFYSVSLLAFEAPFTRACLGYALFHVTKPRFVQQESDTLGLPFCPLSIFKYVAFEEQS